MTDGLLQMRLACDGQGERVIALLHGLLAQPGAGAAHLPHAGVAS